MADSGSRTGLLLGVAWTMTALSIVAIGARFYCRAAFVRSLWWDDWSALIATLFSLAMSITWTVYANMGGTQHAWFLQPEQLVAAGRANWISQPLCIGSLMAGKVAVALLIIRLQAPCRWRRVLLWVLLSIMCIYDAADIIIIFAQCKPAWMLWNPMAAPSDGECLNPKVLVVNGTIASAYMAFIDLALAFIPVQMIWSLKIPASRKVAICVLLSSGVVAFIFAVLKCLALNEDENRTDLLWNNVPLLIWNSVEANVVIVASCVPTIVPLFEVITRRRTASYYNKSQSHGYGGNTKLSSMEGKQFRDNESGDGILLPQQGNQHPWNTVQVRQDFELEEQRIP